MNEVTLDTIRFDDRGLVPAIVQDAETGIVLMLAYMNRESLQRTLDSGETYFWSRQRREIWHKGETSGHVQKVRNVRVDCDSDALLIAVEQKGNACHTGELSCFFTSLRTQETPVATLGEVLGKLKNVIQERHSEMPEGSYTAKLFSGGTDRILKKIGEEAGEVIIAAKNHRREEIVWEVADLLYHMLVLLQHESIATSDIAAELERRSAKM